jgi:hypothetical protein
MSRRLEVERALSAIGQVDARIWDQLERERMAREVERAVPNPDKVIV